MTSAIIALGSNLGDRQANLQAALRLLHEQGIEPVRASSVWETAPVPADQPAFLNAVLVTVTELEPSPLLVRLKAIEHALGRRPGRHWGPRPIDLDILFHGDHPVDTPDLVVPHPRIAERAFVLAPLAEVCRGELPVLGRTALELLDEAGIEGSRRTTEPLLLS